MKICALLIDRVNLRLQYLKASLKVSYLGNLQAYIQPEAERFSEKMF